MMHLILMRDGEELLTQPIDGTVTVGRSPGNTIQLVDDTISRNHCSIETSEDGAIVTDLSSNGTLLNGSRCERSTISAGDIIGIGPWSARICLDAQRNDDTVVDDHRPTQILSYDERTKRISEERIFITASSPRQKPLRRAFTQGEIAIGSHAGSDLALCDDYVSRRHCKIVATEDALMLIDLGSTNGTFIEGARVDRSRLPDEGVFMVGKTRLRFQRERIEHQIEPSEKSALGSILGTSRAMREVFSLIKRAAPTDVPVCIHGESGTGKELAAREIHAHSNRSDKPFVAINCGAIPSNIIESMLFGHERGAFTGAVERQMGVFEQAHGGTLFLDEIGEMALDLQTRLLRVLEEGTVRRLGSREEVAVDARIIVATNKDLKHLVNTERFREDLFFRLYVLPIHLPPLRERTGDIAFLAEHFVKIHAPARRTKSLSLKAIEKLEKHEWRGNVRELKNVLIRAMIMSKAGVIEPDDIQFISAPPSTVQQTELGNQERDAIVEALRKTRGNRSAAARMLGIARSTITYKVARYGIDMNNL